MDFLPVRYIDGYLPIEDHGLIGDMSTCALAGRDGRIGWLCLPRFDSRPVFCGILDRQKGGFFSVRPEQLFWVIFRRLFPISASYQAATILNAEQRSSKIDERLIILGATGDLAARYLRPALVRFRHEGKKYGLPAISPGGDMVHNISMLQAGWSASGATTDYARMTESVDVGLKSDIPPYS
jgi:hypothetical protein